MNIVKGITKHEGKLGSKIRQFNPISPFSIIDEIFQNPNDRNPMLSRHTKEGVQAVSYVVDGQLTWKDKLGTGTLNPGDVQWTVAGKGFGIEEIPQSKSDAARSF